MVNRTAKKLFLYLLKMEYLDPDGTLYPNKKIQNFSIRKNLFTEYAYVWEQISQNTFILRTNTTQCTQKKKKTRPNGKNLQLKGPILRLIFSTKKTLLSPKIVSKNTKTRSLQNYLTPYESLDNPEVIIIHALAKVSKFRTMDYNYEQCKHNGWTVGKSAATWRVEFVGRRRNYIAHSGRFNGAIHLSGEICLHVQGYAGDIW